MVSDASPEGGATEGVMRGGSTLKMSSGGSEVKEGVATSPPVREVPNPCDPRLRNLGVAAG